ncbi:UNVERIFIED_ORG: pentapeptide repeats family protein, partial [Clostridioides difficile Y384]
MINDLTFPITDSLACDNNKLSKNIDLIGADLRKINLIGADLRGRF